MMLWRWLFSGYYARKKSPWRTCEDCGRQKAREYMIHDVLGDFCDEDCQKSWQDRNAI